MFGKKASRESASKRLLVVAERFYPEEFLINDLVQEWQKQGFQIHVLTQTPSYPFDKVFDGYSNRLIQKDQWEGITITRVKTITGYGRSVFLKILNYLFFAFLTSLWCLFKGRKCDRVFVYHTGPLTMATCSLVLHYIYRRKCFIWTTDVWPDTVYAYGFTPTWWKRWILNSFVFVVYSAFEQIFVTSPTIENKIIRFTSRKITYMPQWYPGKMEMTKNSPPQKTTDKIVFLFAGNIGTLQNLIVLVEAFGELRLDNAELRVVGDGINLPILKDLVKTNNYANVVLPGRVPFEEMPEVLSAADVLIISLLDRPVFGLTIPSKFQAYLAAGKAIMVSAPGIVKELVEENEVGLAAKSISIDSIQQTFQEFVNLDREALLRFGENGKNLSISTFSRDKIIASITNEIWKKS